MFQKINIVFSLYSTDCVFDTEKITEYLQVCPTAVHNKGENVVLTVKDQIHEIPMQYKENAWRYETGYISTECIMDAVERFLTIFGEKENAIRCLCDMYNLQSQIMFVIFKSESGHYPDMRIDNRFVKFIGNINAGINFDILE